ncbi:YhcN/YlaJ family sporulation lipoprotein [Ornithinibacillus scapharcae]|uniref:YhcN/YlaJ family sporulation lipoprotein n=1 Tax=Ornithinibacillus scapharcae TaxID=1147159 RepID=UPI000225AA59|nr:YhcN/YlaJ family sporulation lipoprotein [Ornithinibacillus scapharcae]
MRNKIITLAATSFLLVAAGCGNQDEEGQQGTDNNNIEPVRFQNNDDTDYHRNYTLQRDIEESNTYDGNPTQIRNVKNNNAANNNGNDGNGNGEKTNQYDVAEEAADLIEKRVKGIDNVYVFTTDNNAYVAAEVDNKQDGQTSELTDEVKEQISKVVKSVDHDIDNVYVSTNPDFMDLADNYANDLENGEPIEGFFEEMGNMIERVFPENK